MKIKYLEIKNYKQFTDLTLDLSYPNGHDKEGEPLDKICIIGQSGTGKTNLLEIIREKLYTTEVKTYFLEDENSNSEKIYFSRVEKHVNGTIKNQKNIEFSQSDKSLLEDLEDKKNRLVFEKIDSIPKDEDNSYSYLMKNTEKMIGAMSYFSTESHIDKKYRLLNSAIKKIKDKYIKQELISNYNDSIDLNENSWIILKERIENYDIEKANYAKQLANKLVHDNNYSKEDFIFDLKSWENENENILEKIADDINSIIRKFNLELKLDETTNSYEELIIKDLATNTIVEYDDISTGTKNLLSTFIPLKSYNPQDSIILIDEPEISFYPDIQKQLINLYSTVGTNNQLVVATHSPIIASSFEPWEVVELKFDKNNQIYREKYYEGENHIDNYTLDPRMLTWTGILTDIFDLQEDSNFTFREKKLMEYATLKAEIKALKTMEEKEKKFKELQKLSKILGLDN